MKHTPKLTLAALLSGTFLASAALAAGTHPETGEKLADDQTFTYRVLDELSSLDPQIVEDVIGSEFARDLFEGLMSQDEDGNLVPGVATGFDVSDDKLTYTFHLRPEAKWSNGDPVTASDFVFAWQRAADPATASPYQWYMGLMSIANGEAVIAGDMPPSELGVKAIDDQTFEVTLAAPLPYFPQMTTHFTTFPVPAAVIEEHGQDWTKPGNMVSNGAYMLSEHVPQEKLVRVRNENYWDNENTIIETVTSLVINDENVAMTRYLAGELDRTDVPAGQFPRLSEEYPEQAVSVPLSCSYYYMFNMRENGNPALQDVSVRQALSLALDRDVIVEAVLAGGQQPAYTFTHWATAGFETPETEIAGMTQDERNAKAVELMTAAGYGPDNPLEFSLVYNTSESHKSVAIAASQMWKQTLGVEVELSNQEWQTFLEARGNGDYEMARGGWCADYNEASTFLDLFQSGSGYNDSAYNSAEVDGLLAEAKLAEDPQPLYSQIELIASQDVPIIPIYHYASVKMFAENLEGWPYENFQQNWYSKDLYKIAE